MIVGVAWWPGGLVAWWPGGLVRPARQADIRDPARGRRRRM